MELKVAIDGGGDDAVTNVKVNGTKSCISIVVNVYWVQPLRVLLNPSDLVVKWEKAYGRNRSFRKKYLDLIAAVKITAAKDPSISPVAPVKNCSGGFVKSYFVLKVNTNKSGCGFWIAKSKA